MLSHTAKQVYKIVTEAKKILLVPHQNSDGDALGSSTAFAGWLKNEGKAFDIFCVTPPPERFRYLPFTDKIHTCADIWTKEKIDVLVVFDSGDLRYAGIDKYLAAMTEKPIVINIDHHATNEEYGDYNLVIKTSSSTCEMVYRFFRENQVNITGEMATSLMTGLVTDTDNFTNGATSPFALSMAGHLVSLGGHFYHIKEKVYKQTAVTALSVWGKVFSRLKKDEELGLVYTYLTQADLHEAKVSEAEAEGIANFLNNLQEGNFSLTLKEKPDGTIKGSFRTTRDDLDVSAYAEAMGGGGHKKAAGFSVRGPMESAIEHIFETIREINSK